MEKTGQAISNAMQALTTQRSMLNVQLSTLAVVSAFSLFPIGKVSIPASELDV
jgi:hypothetical protein